MLIYRDSHHERIEKKRGEGGKEIILPTFWEMVFFFRFFDLVSHKISF